MVTTPQTAAAEVAERAGAIVTQTRQRIAGVVENMSYLVCAHCGEQTEVFGVDVPWVWLFWSEGQAARSNPGW